MSLLRWLRTSITCIRNAFLRMTTTKANRLFTGIVHANSGHFNTTWSNTSTYRWVFTRKDVTDRKSIHFRGHTNNAITVRRAGLGIFRCRHRTIFRYKLLNIGTFNYKGVARHVRVWEESQHRGTTYAATTRNTNTSGLQVRVNR